MIRKMSWDGGLREKRKMEKIKIIILKEWRRTRKMQKM